LEFVIIVLLSVLKRFIVLCGLGFFLFAMGDNPFHDKQWGAYIKDDKVYAYTKNKQGQVFAISINHATCSNEELRLLLPRKENLSLPIDLEVHIDHYAYRLEDVQGSEHRSLLILSQTLNKNSAELLRLLMRGEQLTINAASRHYQFSLRGSANTIRKAYAMCAKHANTLPVGEKIKQLIAQAEAGDVDAQFALAWKYEQGEEVKKDHQQALKWWQAAARQGNVYAQNNLGIMHEKGHGVAKNYILAYAWYNLAASNGDENASKWRDELERIMTPDQVAIAQVLNPLDEEESILPEEELPDIATTSGSGFFVTNNHVVTSLHVAENCHTIRLRNHDFDAIATEIATDQTNDLLLLRASKSGTALPIRQGKAIRLGDKAIALGYPLGDVLGTGMKATVGTITSLTGLNDDSTTLQVSAPIQPGNSGGPLLDEYGSLVGLVYARYEETPSGRNAQNVNFAIKKSVVMNFLDVHTVDYTTAKPEGTAPSSADVIEKAEKGVVQVVCEEE
jgi:TPR repeat protein